MVGLGTTEPHYFTSTWLVERTAPQQISDFDRERGVRPNDEWFYAWCDHEGGAGVGAPDLGMIHDYLQLLGLVRRDPEPGDDEGIIERWSPA